MQGQEQMGRFLNHLYIYGDDSLGVNLDHALDYMRGLLPDTEIELRKDFLKYHLTADPVLKQVQDHSGLDPLAERLAGIKVLNPVKEGLNPDPIYGEIDYERRKILNPSAVSIGIMYDGFRMQAILYPLITKEEKGKDHLHVVLTSQLVVTWESYDMRYHLRVGVYGRPSIVSVSGIVEAPAKPREFYIMKQMVGTGELSMADLKKGFDKRFIDYKDPRMTDVLKGYLAQAIFYHIFGDPFCDDRGCRLFNAHWQEEMIYAQLKSPYEFCDRHTAMIADCTPHLSTSHRQSSPLGGEEG